MPVRIIAVFTLLVCGGLVGWYVGQDGVDRPDTPPSAERSAVATSAPSDPVDALPKFVDPPAGPRAPSYAIFGLHIGRTTLAEARRFVADRGLTCKDTSVRAQMAAYRAKKAAEVAAAKAANNADGVSGASWLDRSTRHEKNPQVRLTCDKARLSLIGDRPRPEDTIGRLLLIFDAADLPLRHITIQRRYVDDSAAALRAFQEAERAFRTLFGEPVMTRHPATDGQAFGLMRPVRREWRFADLEARVSALRLKNGVTIFESVGVPWPVRSDAPMRQGVEMP